MTENNTLLVIGNGFDLQCGLNSSYEDFFDWLSEDNERANDNLWAIHFLNSPREGGGWADIESRLQKVIGEKRTGQPDTLLDFWHSTAVSFYKNFYDSGIRQPISEYLMGRGSTLLDQGTVYVVKQFVNRRSELDALNSYWFLDELKRFER